MCRSLWHKWWLSLHPFTPWRPSPYAALCTIHPSVSLSAWSNRFSAGANCHASYRITGPPDQIGYRHKSITRHYQHSLIRYQFPSPLNFSDIHYLDYKYDCADLQHYQHLPGCWSWGKTRKDKVWKIGLSPLKCSVSAFSVLTSQDRQKELLK